MVEILVSGVESRFAGTEASNLCLSETWFSLTFWSQMRIEECFANLGRLFGAPGWRNLRLWAHRNRASLPATVPSSHPADVVLLAQFRNNFHSNWYCGDSVLWRPGRRKLVFRTWCHCKANDLCESRSEGVKPVAEWSFQLICKAGQNLEPPFDAKVIRPGGWKAYLGGSLAAFGSSAHSMLHQRAIPSSLKLKENWFRTRLAKNRTQVLRAAWGTGRELLVFVEEKVCQSAVTSVALGNHRYKSLWKVVNALMYWCIFEFCCSESIFALYSPLNMLPEGDLFWQTAQLSFWGG